MADPIVRGPATTWTKPKPPKKPKKKKSPWRWLNPIYTLGKLTKSQVKTAAKATGLSKAFKERPEEYKQFSSFTPQQESLQDSIGGALLKLLTGSLGNKFDFEPIAEEARRKYYSETIPTIANRFTAMGGQHTRRSSSFQKALRSSSNELERGLAALQSQYGIKQQALNQSLIGSLMSPALANRFESLYTKRSPGGLESLLPPVAQGIAAAAPKAIMAGLMG